MSDVGKIRLTRLHTELGQIVYEMTRVQVSQFGPPELWQPAINAYRCEQGIAICVELAGIDKEMIEVSVEPRRLLIQGRREPPEPAGADRRTLQILAMEIDHGPFRRELALPLEVEPERVTAEQRNGLLWIYLPLRPNG